MITKTFSGISDNQWQEIKSSIKEEGGFSVDADSGTTNVKGVHFSWVYESENLTITILSVSFADRVLGHNENSIMNDFSKWISEIK